MLCRDLVRLRNQNSKMQEFHAQLRSIAIRVSSCSSINELGEAMGMASSAIMSVSAKLDPAKLNAIAMELAKGDEKLDMQAEMMADVLDGIGESNDDPEAEEQMYQAVLMEVGLEGSNEVKV